MVVSTSTHTGLCGCEYLHSSLADVGSMHLNEMKHICQNLNVMHPNVFAFEIDVF